MRLPYRQKGDFSIFNQIETATKSLISKMKRAKTEITEQNVKTKTKKRVFTTVTSVYMAMTVAFVSVFDVFGAYEFNDEAEKETIQATLVTQRTVSLTIPNSMGSSSVIVGDTESLENLIEGYEVYVDGEPAGIVSVRGKTNLESHFSQLLAEHDTDREAEIYQEVSYKKGLFDAVDVVTSNTILSLYKFEVAEVEEITDREVIPFETVYENSDELYIGKSKVSVAGVNGEKTTVTKVYYLDGKEVSRNTSSSITKKAVNKVVLKGTKEIPPLSSAQIEAVGGVAFPLGDADCYVSSDFGYRSFDDSFHDGIDYAADYGTPVYSAMSGKVIFAGWDNTGYGNYIIIEHADGYKTAYAHLSEIVVSKGDVISAGKCIGAVGSTGYSTGNHLHFSMLLNNQFINPAQFY